jgi:hypothetical protein
MKENEELWATPKAVVFLSLGGFSESRTDITLHNTQLVIDALNKFMSKNSMALMSINDELSFVDISKSNSN